METRKIGLMPLMGALALLAACEPAKIPDVTAEELTNDPDRTREIMRLCREDRDKVSDNTCAAARIARRAQFMGDGKTKYTPGGVEPETPEKQE